ncbi:adenylosuccinate lyase [Rarobacter faecitabidus]|uniref:Adenylosuccinate lyase n=1 Tax=Rarobacter faecitabidus TaxID=13243 RepID=A0A542ZP65_RARFA|nr:adenylosuccinate lyase [Rarobacter faecitabidus]TQL62142.1 adenylosuccinate lyase [Rarobacter faecitabidus]
MPDSSAASTPERVSLASAEPAIALGPLDGRYRSTIAPLVDYLSEAALNRERIHVEVEWLIALTGAITGGEPVVPGAPTLTEDEIAYLRAIPATFGASEIAELAEIERETVHDVKAVEYFIKRRLAAAPEHLGEGTSLPGAAELVHFACTSEDINNLSYALMVRGAVTGAWLPAANALADQLAAMAHEHAAVPLLALTHGQPATPTTLGKELGVLAHRLRRQLRRIDAAEYLGKLNGATGTFGAHTAAVPGANWPAVSRAFVEHLGLTWNPLTTQIESHDWQAELYSDIARFNRVLHNLATDVWTYISLGVFKQIPVPGATGSSTMPHKVNPIRFENAEANLEISSALLDTLASTLVTSRLQRDLTDSTTQRNIGPAFGHSLLAIDNVAKGLSRLAVDTDVTAGILDRNWEVLGEAIQSAMRAAGIAGTPGMENPYERLKELTRGHRIGAEDLRAFVATLGLPADVEARIAALTPGTYVGLAESLVKTYLD